MNRINELLEKKKKGIFSVYYTAGFPNLDDTLPILKELQKQGVDIVEVGIPFSDPIADGVVIQNSGSIALKNGMSLNVLFDQLKDMRKEITIPVILMGYLNPMLRYGFEDFCRKCKETGVDGLVIPDLPFKDYLEVFKPIAVKYDLKIIMLITPETSDERIRFIDEHTDGFIYMVSSSSTTGAQQSFDDSKQSYFQRVNQMNLRNPRMIGFGISNKSTYDAACAESSGTIIGSHFIKLLQSCPGDIPMAVSRLLDIRKA